MQDYDFKYDMEFLDFTIKAKIDHSIKVFKPIEAPNFYKDANFQEILTGEGEHFVRILKEQDIYGMLADQW